jgi:heme O synthase-like polyprenyltransferase
LTVSQAALEKTAARGAAEVLRDYGSLLKPRIVVLLVATAVGAMLPAAHGFPHPLRVLAVILGP